MPYFLRKAPRRELYWVVSRETGAKHSKDPMPRKKAEAQMKALYMAMGKEQGLKGKGLWNWVKKSLGLRPNAVAPTAEPRKPTAEAEQDADYDEEQRMRMPVVSRSNTIEVKPIDIRRRTVQGELVPEWEGWYDSGNTIEPFSEEEEIARRAAKERSRRKHKDIEGYDAKTVRDIDQPEPTVYVPRPYPGQHMAQSKSGEVSYASTKNTSKAKWEKEEDVKHRKALDAWKGWYLTKGQWRPPLGFPNGDARMREIPDRFVPAYLEELAQAAFQRQSDYVAPNAGLDGRGKKKKFKGGMATLGQRAIGNHLRERWFLVDTDLKREFLAYINSNVLHMPHDRDIRDPNADPDDVGTDVLRNNTYKFPNSDSWYYIVSAKGVAEAEARMKEVFGRAGQDVAERREWGAMREKMAERQRARAAAAPPPREFQPPPPPRAAPAPPAPARPNPEDEEDEEEEAREDEEEEGEEEAPIPARAPPPAKTGGVPQGQRMPTKKEKEEEERRAIAEAIERSEKEKSLPFVKPPPRGAPAPKVAAVPPPVYNVDEGDVKNEQKRDVLAIMARILRAEADDITEYVDSENRLTGLFLKEKPVIDAEIKEREYLRILYNLEEAKSPPNVIGIAEARKDEHQGILKGLQRGYNRLKDEISGLRDEAVAKKAERARETAGLSEELVARAKAIGYKRPDLNGNPQVREIRDVRRILTARLDGIRNNLRRVSDSYEVAKAINIKTLPKDARLGLIGKMREANDFKEALLLERGEVGRELNNAVVAEWRLRRRLLSEAAEAAGLEYPEGEEEGSGRYKGAGIWDVIKDAFNPKKVINEITNPDSIARRRISDVGKGIRTGYPPSSRATIERYGDWRIVALHLRRDPVQSAIHTAFNILSLGQWDKARRDSNFDRLFHLGLVATVEKNGERHDVLIEKNEVINIGEAKPKMPGSEIISTPAPNTTLEDFLIKGEEAVGRERFFLYDPFKYNCQDFIMALLSANGVLTKPAQTFIKQDIVSLVERLPSYVAPVARAITDIGALANVALEGGAVTRSSPVPKFMKQLKKAGYEPSAYLEEAKRRAKKNHYPYKLLGFATDGEHKLAIPDAEGRVVAFGRVGYGDHLIYSHLEAAGSVPSGTALKKQSVFQKSHSKIKGDWRQNPFSPNNLAMKILW